MTKPLSPTLAKKGYITKSIGELVKDTRNVNPKNNPDGEFFYIDVSSVSNSSCCIESPTKLLGKDAPSRARKEVQEGDIIFATVRPTLKRVAIVGKELDGQICSTGFVVLRTTDVIYNKYLFYFLTSNNFLGKMKKLQKGASYPAVKDSDIKNQLVSFPESLDEQKRIVHILDSADALRQKRREAINLLDVCVQSVFLEMFGDPVKNSKGWEVEALGETSEKITDGEHQNPIHQRSGNYLVKAKDILESGVDFGQENYVSQIDFDKFTKKCKPERGDLLLVSRGATIGRCTTVNVDTPFCLMGSVILVKPDKQKMNGAFLNYVFKFPSIKRQLVKTSGSSAQQAIYIAHLKKMKTILPKLSIQNEFADIVNRQELLKQKMLMQKEKLDMQFDSLLQRAFAGTL